MQKVTNSFPKETGHREEIERRGYNQPGPASFTLNGTTVVSTLTQFEVSSLKLKRQYQKNGNDENCFCSVIISYSETMMHTHSSSIHCIPLKTATPPPSTRIKEKPECHTGRFKPQRCNCCYAGAIHRALPGRSPSSSPLQQSQNKLALGKCYINSKS